MYLKSITLKKKIFIILDKLGNDTKVLKYLRWCINYYTDKTAKVHITFLCNRKKYNVIFILNLALKYKGPLLELKEPKNHFKKYFGINRHNKKFLE